MNEWMNNNNKVINMWVCKKTSFSLYCLTLYIIFFLFLLKINNYVRFYDKEKKFILFFNQLISFIYKTYIGFYKVFLALQINAAGQLSKQKIRGKKLFLFLLLNYRRQMSSYQITNSLIYTVFFKYIFTTQSWEGISFTLVRVKKDLSTTFKYYIKVIP